MNRSVLHPAGAGVPSPRFPGVDRGAAGTHLLTPLLLTLLLAAAALPARAAPAFVLPSSPLFLQTAVNPNVLVMFDNSQSMDATMAGKMIQGSDPSTRTSIARDVLRNVITTYRYNFNWGLGSFDISGKPLPKLTFVYYLGDSSSMRYTNTCDSIVDGVGVSDLTGTYTKVVDGIASEVTGNLPCVQNPPLDGTPTNGYKYITYARSSDDADVNDVYYESIKSPETEVYGVGSIGSSYKAYRSRDDTTGWEHVNFDRCSRTGLFKPCKETPFLATDAGFVPDAVKSPRLIMARRAMGYDNDITGTGKINEPIVSSQTTTVVEVAAESSHNVKLLALLADEDMDPASANIKNAARRTPLAGALQTSRQYFSNTLTGSPSPVTASCQRNYVVLATDGNPTGKKDGTAYDLAARTNTKDPATGLWTFGLAVNDVLEEVRQLKALPLTGAYGTNPDGVPTYVIGLGDGVINQSSVAALNEMASQGGTSKAYLANSSEALNTAFQTITAKIREGDAAASAVTLDSGNYHSGSTLYQAKFNGKTWTGELSAFVIEATGATAATSDWQASSKITAQDWNSGRVILTYKPATATLPSTGVAFRWPVNPAAPEAGELAVAQTTALNTNASGTAVDGFGSARLEYLRGRTSREARFCTTCTPQFHNRTTTTDGAISNVLGDIVDSTPFYVGPPAAGHDDFLETASYSAFAASHAKRQPYLYVGANDGMLHAINASTGQEKFAYVPNLVFSKLSRQTAVPYVHQYTVDGSPVVGDVFYTGDGAWHSLLVSGLRAGGRGLFALDVTDPSGVTETNASSVVRWEVSDTGLGHVFAAPALVRTHKDDGKWSVIVGNGYNAVDSAAYLFVIDAESGDVTKIRAGTGSSTGLSGARPVDVDGDGTIDVVYAGDLDGNLWKFDLTSGSPASWSATLLFAAGSTKPITVQPDVTPHPKGGFMVTFATGRYLALGDVATTETQTAYGIWDKAGSTSTVTADQLQQQIVETGTTASNGNTFRFSTHRVGVARDMQLGDDLPTTTVVDFYANDRGWYFDLPTSGERVVADPTIRGGRAIFTSIIPTVSATCEPSGTSWILEVDVFTGNRLGTATFNTNADVKVNDEDFLKATPTASGTTNTTGWRIEGLATAPVFMTREGPSGGTIETKTSNTSEAKLPSIDEYPGTIGQGRVMWRVVQ